MTQASEVTIFKETEPKLELSAYVFENTLDGVLIKNADTAMYVAKDSGRNTIRFYAPESDS